MGLKYIELTKSIILTILVILSLVLTFSIWSYTPNLQTIDEAAVEQITVGPEKTINEVIKPYRILFSEENTLRGTLTSSEIDEIISKIANWNATEFKFVQSNLTEQKINNLINYDKRITLFYESEVPLSLMNSMMLLSGQTVPEISFNRLIIDWNNLSAGSITIYFISNENDTLYSTEITMNEQQFLGTIIEPTQNLRIYHEIVREDELSLYVPENQFELYNYTYYIDEIPPDTFKDILFIEPSIVKRIIDSSSTEKYIDGMSLMTVDKGSKTFNYVYPTSESFGEVQTSKLLQDSFDFVNEHGGFTGDYRYKNINPTRHIVEYQLYLRGLPVFSSITLTKITTTWGDNQIFRYRRPYYNLDMDISTEKNVSQLPSGIDTVNSIEQSKTLDLENIDELYIGYYLKKENDLIYTFEPSWFAIINGSWIRLTTELLKGDEYGLE
nr:two-component system activity regulator YycH [Lysinibacillus timonensis]